MSENPKIIEAVAGWARKAEGDLLTAEHTMQLGERCPRFAVCFHCQQCVEKYLKGFLTFLGISAPKTHNLNALFDLIPKSAGLDLPITEIPEPREKDIEAIRR